MPTEGPHREWMTCASAPDEIGLSVALIDGWDPVLAYRTGGHWYESPHDPIDDDVTMFMELRVDDLIRWTEGR